jgi:hypothetical protein
MAANEPPRRGVGRQVRLRELELVEEAVLGVLDVQFSSVQLRTARLPTYRASTSRPTER